MLKPLPGNAVPLFVAPSRATLLTAPTLAVTNLHRPLKFTERRAGRISALVYQVRVGDTAPICVAAPTRSPLAAAALAPALVARSGTCADNRRECMNADQGDGK